MINENILDKCFRISSSLINHRISPLTIKYECPQLSLLIITKRHTPINGTQSYCIIPCWTIQARACLEHSNLLKVKSLITIATTQWHYRYSSGCGESKYAGAFSLAPQNFNYELFNCNNFNRLYFLCFSYVCLIFFSYGLFRCSVECKLRYDK